MAANDGDRASRKRERSRQHPDELVVGGAVDGRRGERDRERFAVNADDAARLRPGLRVNLDADRTVLLHELHPRYPTSMRSVVLSGFMATGKSTVGERLAERLGLPFVDTDAIIAARAGAPVSTVFAREGEARFRELEKEIALGLLADPAPKVIAFGGGTVTIGAVRREAVERATVVTLTASPETVVSRAAAVHDRPNLDASDRLARARDLMDLRREVYAECHAALSTEALGVDAVVERIAALARVDRLAVPLGGRSYGIDLADGAPERLADVVQELAPSSLVVVSDTNVMRARGAWLEAALGGYGGKRLPIVITPGEASKTLATVSRIWDVALGGGVDRDALVVAFGGGVVGDLAGFAASTLLRGVRCVHTATSLLSMVDSSVGGKTGFDHATGKNLVGAFFQPARVILDLEHLATLDPRERACGLAEIVKIAWVRDRALLDALEADAARLAAGDRAALAPIVRAAVQAKIRVVCEDEREAGVRALLNLGHTVGHGLEAAAGYGALLHGEAVAIGTVLEMEATERLGLTPEGLAARAAALLTRFGLPTRRGASELAAAWPFVLADKKKAGTTVKLPVVTGPGEARVQAVSFDALHAALHEAT